MVDATIFTESEEMYLLSIARLIENGVEPPVPISLLAGELNISAISANQMVRKLEECGLVTYAPYKGVELTEDGRLAALRVLRHRRLWEVFLAECLQFTPDEAESQACRLEHVFPDDAAERLAQFLGYPASNPRGKAIPASGSQAQLHTFSNLASLSAGASGLVRQVSADPAARAFLAGQGIAPGTRLTVLATSQDGDCLLESAEGGSLHISASLAQAIWIQPVGSE